MAETGEPVELYIYDLTHGLASVLSPAIIGQQIEGVWHTAIVVYGREYFYGGHGITNCAPGGTQLGAPQRVQRLGETFVPYQVFVDYLHGLATTNYTGGEYRLLEHNCNHFSDEVAQFLCGARVPKNILLQPDALPPPLRLALQALLGDMQAKHPQAAAGAPRREDSPDFCALNHQVDQARAASAQLEARRLTLAEKLARRERRREKKRRKHRPAGDDGSDTEMAEAVEAAPVPEPLGLAGPSSQPEPDLDTRRLEEERRRAKDPPIVYKDIDGAAEYERLAAALGDSPLNAEEHQSLDELQQYLVHGEGSWVLGDDFLAFLGRLLNESSEAVREAALRCLAACALREDVSLVLHQDRRHHALLSYAARVDMLPLPEQRALALFMCNLFENISSSEWLLYISEWECAGQPMSNIRATTKVCVHATLAEDPELRELGTALMYNVATKEVKTVRFQRGKPLRDLLPRQAKSKVFDEVCVELAMALLQLLQWAPAEAQLWRALAALARLAAHSPDVPQLVAMVGPDPAAFRGTSERVDEQIDLIMKKLK